MKHPFSDQRYDAQFTHRASGRGARTRAHSGAHIASRRERQRVGWHTRRAPSCQAMSVHSCGKVTSDAHSARDGQATLTRTDEIDRALAAGGAPIVADVLGVVCDFCAIAMNKIFGDQPEVAAVYVDLDTKALSLVLSPSGSLSDAAIADLAVQAGYRIAAIRRDEAALGGSL